MSSKLFTYHEHYDKELEPEQSKLLSKGEYSKWFKYFHNNQEKYKPCFTIRQFPADVNHYHLKTGYFVGVDWLEVNKTAIYVAPKLNDKDKETDYIKMLFSCISRPEVSHEISDLFHIKWDDPKVEIKQKQDLLTPFLVVEFLGLLKTIVRKGLKKSYYKVEQNLNSRVKGKVLVSKTIKHNRVQNKQLQTWCSFHEFGINNAENRLLNKALHFVKSYLPTYAGHLNFREVQDSFNYISPAFQSVSNDISLNEIKQTKTNVFYKEYAPALKLAKLILKRFGYNISNTVKEKVQTPPFWIDMSKLFELYVLGLLRKRFHNEVKYHFTTWGNELDYLLKSDKYKMVIDAKYIPAWKENTNHENVRQVSGYARLKKVHKHLYDEESFNKVVDCLIIYPDQKGADTLEEIDIKQNIIKDYYGFYKLGVKIPVIQ